MPLDDLEDLRNGDPAKEKIFEHLAAAVDRVRKESFRDLRSLPAV
jgi:hypothetical protein